MLIETAHFRVHSPRSYQSKWCTDSRIALRLLAYRPRDSGQFRRFRGKEMLGAELYQSGSLADGSSKILESHESLSDSDVRSIPFHGIPG